MAVICPKCEQSNPDTATHCRNCNFSLDAITTEVSIDETELAEMTVFPVLEPITSDENTNYEGTETRNIDAPDEHEGDNSQNFGESRMRGGIILFEPQSRKVFRVAFEDLDEVVIGRTHQKTGYIPTVDLSVVEGHMHGVSRRHATLSRDGSLLKLVDHHSVNGTFLNGQRLVAEQARIVRDQDTIRLGSMVLRVIYVKQ